MISDSTWNIHKMIGWSLTSYIGSILLDKAGETSTGQYKLICFYALTKIMFAFNIGNIKLLSVLQHQSNKHYPTLAHFGVLAAMDVFLYRPHCLLFVRLACRALFLTRSACATVVKWGQWNRNTNMKPDWVLAVFLSHFRVLTCAARCVEELRECYDRQFWLIMRPAMFCVWLAFGPPGKSWHSKRL